MSKKYTTWASQALESEVAAPPAEKQLSGWTEEIPPHEWFNWHMRRTDTRLDELENPVTFAVYELLASERNEVILANQSFYLPIKYVVGKGQLHVYMDGLLCHAGENQQYVECGPEFSESNYFRWNDDIPTDFDIRIEIPVEAKEPVIYADETLVGNVNALIERVDKLEEPVFSTRLDSPANTRAKTVKAGEIFVLDGGEYTVAANQLQVFKNGVLLYDGFDYREVGVPGQKSTDIIFTKDVPVTDSLRVYIPIKNAEEYTILGSADSLATIEDKVAMIMQETRIDKIVETRIEALADYTVPAYRVGAGTLKIYKNGLLLAPNRDYTENADDGPISTRIIWNASVDRGTLLTVIVPTKVE